jgi:phosphatidylglycerophosphate synthase
MFEKMRGAWTKAIEPLVLKLGNLDPSILTWGSLVVALLAFYMLSGAGLDNDGAMMIGGAVLLIMFAGVLDALDGALARHQGVDSPYGDFLDHIAPSLSRPAPESM